ncbi:MAG TPA: membrane protein insertase YidC, partial [Nitrospiria bacterium]
AEEEAIKDDPADIDGELRHRGTIHWTALQDKYFVAAAIPDQPATAVVWRPNPETVEAGLEFDVSRKGGTSSLMVFAGPKEHDRLKSLGVQLEELIDFGWFMFGSWGIVRFLAEPLFYVLRFFDGYTGNYGVSIILLTVCVRIIFIPLTHKAYSSMKNMQVLQPQLKVLQNKYKDDKQKLQKEMLALYQENKVNPLGGCLPMLLQIPVFVALFNVLYNTIELRQAPFYLWIHDLSLRDPFFVFPVVMGATMVLQQKIQPTTLEPTQAKIMLMMPVVITFLFLSFPSGLVIYMLTNNVLTITQQYFTMKHFDKTHAKPQAPKTPAEEPEAPPVERPGGGKKSRPKKGKSRNRKP